MLINVDKLARNIGQITPSIFVVVALQEEFCLTDGETLEKYAIRHFVDG